MQKELNIITRKTHHNRVDGSAPNGSECASQTSDRKFPLSPPSINFPPLESLSRTIREVSTGRGGSFSINLSPYSPSLSTPTETRKITKKPAFTVSRKIPDSKELTFLNRNKTICFLSVFSVLIYIFEKITNARK